MRVLHFNDVVPTEQLIWMKLASETQVDPSRQMAPGEVAARKFLEDDPKAFNLLLSELNEQHWKKVREQDQRKAEEEARKEPAPSEPQKPRRSDEQCAELAREFLRKHGVEA